MPEKSRDLRLGLLGYGADQESKTPDTSLVPMLEEDDEPKPGDGSITYQDARHFMMCQFSPMRLVQLLKASRLNMGTVIRGLGQILHNPDTRSKERLSACELLREILTEGAASFPEVREHVTRWQKGIEPPEDGAIEIEEARNLAFQGKVVKAKVS